MEITYHGTPVSGLYFAYHQNQPLIYSLDEPALARNWFPCYDFPSDKALVDMRISVPKGMICASNGTLTDIQKNGSHTTYIWSEGYPISTYLISVAATDYKTFSDTYAAGSNQMDVLYYVYPEHLDLSREDFSKTISMIRFFSDAFGEYPFLKEKYGMAEIPGTAAMEHQTCTSYSSQLITGNHAYDWVIAHELAHQWWGDLVTLSDWADIWLNEGFATYSDALWHEHLQGFEGLKSRMQEFKTIYRERYQDIEHPIYDPPEGYLFSAIEYEKGAWVLHMLRFVLGEECFWSSLSQYVRTYAYGNATTEEFQSICEQVSGKDLDWFFDEWIYEAGYPVYSFGWGNTASDTTRVVIEQTQKEFPLFSMPVEIRFILSSETVKKIVWISEKTHVFEFILPEKPMDVLFDPDEWILCAREDFQKKNVRKR